MNILLIHQKVRVYQNNSNNSGKKQRFSIEKILQEKKDKAQKEEMEIDEEWQEEEEEFIVEKILEHQIDEMVRNFT